MAFATPVAYFVAIVATLAAMGMVFEVDNKPGVAHNWVAVATAAAVVVVATIVATVVAVAGTVDMGLVVVASFNPPYNVTQYTLNLVYLWSTTQSMIVSNYTESA